jgi:hypothetical protein
MIVIAASFVTGCNSGDDSKKASTSKGGNTDGTKASKKKAKSEKNFFPLVLEEDFAVFSDPKKTDANAPPTWTVEGDVLKCSGDPRGYIYTHEPHHNFTLRFEFRYPALENPDDVAKLNTGVLVYIPISEDEGESAHKLWPVSLEVQGKHVEMGHIKPNGGAADIEISEDTTARETARNPPGEWNSVEIVSKGGALTAYLNETKICESKPGELNDGAIGLQSESAEVHFRNLRIRDEEEDE